MQTTSQFYALQQLSTLKFYLFSLLLFLIPKMVSAETVGIFYDHSIAQHEFAAGDIKTALELKGFTTEKLNLATLSDSYANKKIVISLANNSVVTSLLTTQGGTAVSSLGEQAYALRTTSTPISYWIFGGDANGAMYGGLQIAENINFNGYSGTYNVEDSPYLKNRGIKFNMPMDAKAPTYFSDNDGKSHKEAIKNVWDSTFWYTWFDEMARHRYNVLSLWTNHPFTSMIHLEEYALASIQGVQGYDSNGNKIQINNMTIQEKIRFWQRVMKYGRSRGFDIYFCTWNINLNTAMGKGYDVEESITDPETKVYVKKCMIEFLKTYPDLKGFGVTAGEKMSGGDENKASWMWDTYGSAMLEYAQANLSRELVFIHRQHDGNVDLMMQNFKPLQDQPNVRLDISFKYSQAHAHAAVDPSFIDEKNILESCHEYNLKTWLTIRNDDFFYLPWADPQFVRDYVNTIPEVGTSIESIYIGADGWTFSREWASKDPYYKNKNALSIQKTWLMQKVWGRISYNPNVSNDLFKKHLNFKYPEVPSNDLFQAWTDASKALKLANEQVTGDSRDLDMEWWPEGWTSLADGFLSLANTDNAGPMNGSNLCSFASTASGSCNGKTSAWETADQIENLASGALGIISSLNAGSNTELGLNLKDIKAMSHLGLFNAYKFRAAIYSKQGKTSDARVAMGTAYCNWKSYTNLMDELYIGATMQRNHSFATWHDHDVDALKDYTDLGGIGIPDCGKITSVNSVNISGCPSSELTVGSAQQLTANISPINASNKLVTWTTSNSDVATVSSTVLVTAVSEGSVTISVTTSDAGFTSTCNITVIPIILDKIIELTSWLPGNSNPKADGLNRMMVVMVMGEKSESFTANAVTYGGQTMTKVTEKSILSGSATYSAIFILKETSVNAATSGTINVTWSSAPAGSSIYSVLLANVDQTTAIVSANEALASATTISTTLAAESADMIVMCGATASNKIQTFNNNFIKKYESDSGWGDGVGGYKISLGETETLSFTQSEAGRMTLCAMVLKLSGGVVPVTGVSLSESSPIGLKIEGTRQLTAILAPANATIKSLSWSSSNTSVATVNTSGLITAVSAGSTLIKVITLDGGYKDSVVCNVVNKTDQSISFPAITGKTIGDADFTLSATASSGLQVSYASSNTSVATIVGNKVHILATGTTSITASQSGNAEYKKAPDVSQILVVNKASQSISFTTLANKTFGDVDYALTATANSGLQVSYASSNTSIATIVGNKVHIVGAGTTTITASQGGNANYNSAPDATQTLVVNKANQSIAFSALADKTIVDADFALTATATSGLEVSYASLNTNVATVSGNMVHIVGAGTSTITASQTGDNNYNAALNVSQSFTVTSTNPSTIIETDNKNNIDFNISPVPCKNYITVESNNTNVNIKIYSITGKLMLSQQMVNLKQIIDLRSLEKGMYIIKMISKDEIKSMSIIKEE